MTDETAKPPTDAAPPLRPTHVRILFSGTTEGVMLRIPDDIEPPPTVGLLANFLELHPDVVAYDITAVVFAQLLTIRLADLGDWSR